MALNTKNPLQNRTKDTKCGYLQGIDFCTFMQTIVYILRLFFPSRTSEEHEHGEELESARQHIEYQYQLRERREESIVLRRSNKVKSGAYIVDSGRRSREVGGEIKVVDGQKKHRYHKCRNVADDIGVDRPYDLAVHRS